MDNTQRTLEQKMAESRIIFLSGVIDTNLANYVIMNLLSMDADSHDDIYLYINSVGGSVQDGLAIIDTMNLIESDVCTIAIGNAASMAAVILAAGKVGKRKALPNASILLHQVMGGAQGQASEIEIAYRRINRLKGHIIDMLANYTGQSKKRIEEDCDRDFWLNAKEAIDYGLVDLILSNK